MVVRKLQITREGLIGLALIGLAFPVLSGYLLGAPSQVFYLLLAVMSIRYEGRGRGGYRFGGLALLSILGFVLLQARILYVLALAYFLLFLLEKNRGRINDAPLFAAVLAWPAAKYLLDLISFPLRLSLTDSVGLVLSYLPSDITVTGNVITREGTEFVVADACLGLSLLQAGLLICLFLIGRYDRRSERNFRWWLVGLTLIVTVVLVMLANWTRILLTVLFKSMPDTAGHEVIGLLCLLIYVLLPLSGLIPALGKRWGGEVRRPRYVRMPGQLVWLVPVFFLLIFVYPSYFQRRTFDPEIRDLTMPGYCKDVLENGVLRFVDEKALVYLKPGVSFSASDHHPKICWQGSGYRFGGERIAMIGEREVMMAKLITPAGETWHSCWWYDNGTQQTISQWEWRKRSLLTGKPFRLVNITCEEETTLRSAVLSWQQNGRD